MPSAQISLTLSRNPFLSFIASSRSPGLYPISSLSCCMKVRSGRPNFAQICVGVHRSTSLMSSSLLLQECPTNLVRLKLNNNNNKNRPSSKHLYPFPLLPTPQNTKSMGSSVVKLKASSSTQ